LFVTEAAGFAEEGEDAARKAEVRPQLEIDERGNEGQQHAEQEVFQFCSFAAFWPCANCARKFASARFSALAFSSK